MPCASSKTTAPSTYVDHCAMRPGSSPNWPSIPDRCRGACSTPRTWLRSSRLPHERVIPCETPAGVTNTTFTYQRDHVGISLRRPSVHLHAAHQCGHHRTQCRRRRHRIYGSQRQHHHPTLTSCAASVPAQPSSTLIPKRIKDTGIGRLSLANDDVATLAQSAVLHVVTSCYRRIKDSEVRW